ncbi:Hypothetical predicted protein [Mytilus galloprovincialis]|uniref:Uncharacterized protein n=1 Tax=Mytilus galloprovincialis TaxID=29158 RepID=A0A8B6GES1_MYTGA|nr:Hypothetical predicted protein [Mytilus galloprovincialis]
MALSVEVQSQKMGLQSKESNLDELSHRLSDITTKSQQEIKQLTNSMKSLRKPNGEKGNASLGSRTSSTGSLNTLTNGNGPNSHSQQVPTHTYRQFSPPEKIESVEHENKIDNFETTVKIDDVTKIECVEKDYGIDKVKINDNESDVNDKNTHNDEKREKADDVENNINEDDIEMDHTDSDHSDHSDEFSFPPLSEIAQTDDQPSLYQDPVKTVIKKMSYMRNHDLLKLYHIQIQIKVKMLGT